MKTKIKGMFRCKQKISVSLVFVLIIGCLRVNTVVAKSFDIVKVQEIPNSTITCIYQTDANYLLLGTKSGLYSYDGFKVYKGIPHSEDLTSFIGSTINDITETENEFVIATSEGAYAVNKKTFKSKKYNFSQKSEAVRELNISAVLNSKNNYLWFASNKFGVAVLGSEKDTETFYYSNVKDDPTSLSSNKVIDIIEDKNGLIWIATQTHLNRFNPSQNNFERIIVSDAPIQINEILAVVNRIYIATKADGLFIFDNSQNSVQQIMPDSLNPELSNHISGLVVFEGIVYVSSDDKGIFHIEGDKVVENNVLLNGFANNFFSTLKSVGNNIYFATHGGEIGALSRRYTAEATLGVAYPNNKWISCFSKDNFNRIWAGHYGGALSLYDRSSILMNVIVTPSSESLHPDYTIRAITTDAIGNIWVGTQGAGLLNYEPIQEKIIQSFKHDVNDTTTLASNVVNDVIIDEQSNMFIATPNGFQKKLSDDKGFENILWLSSGNEYVNPKAVNDLFFSKTNELWLATEKGLWKYNKQDNYLVEVLPQVLSTLEIKSFGEGASEDVIWLTHSEGVSEFNIGNLTNYPVSLTYKFNDLKVNAISENHEGLWLATGAGAFLRKPTGEVLKISKELNVNQTTIDNAGNVVFGSVNGIFGYESNAIESLEALQVPNISAVYINNERVNIAERIHGRKILRKELSQTKRLVLNRKTRNISFGIADLQNDIYTNYAIAYRIEGLNSQWSLAGNGEITLPNIPYGRHKLEYNISDDFGRVLPQAETLKIKVRKPIWLSVWFYLALLSVVIYFLRQQLVENKEKYRGKLKEQEKALQEKKKAVEKKIQKFNEERLDFRSRMEEERILRYHADGLAMFSEELAHYQDDLKTLCQKMIVKLVEFLELNQGMIYLINDEDESRPILEPMGGFGRDDSLDHTFEISEGYVGTCFKEGKLLEIKNLPEDYTVVTSGLGKDTPDYLIVVPIQHNELKLGVIELTSFGALAGFKKEFIEKLADNIASTVAISYSSAQIHKMLEASKEQAEELRSSEEELRQNLEEMKATQEELHRQAEENEKYKQELEQENALLDSLMNNSPDYIYFKDWECKFIRISKSMLRLFPYDKLEDMDGKSDFDFQPKEVAQKYYDAEQQIMKTGNALINDIQHEVMSNGVEQWVATTKMPLFNRKGECIGLFGITKDITDLKKLEIEATQKAAMLEEQEEELRQNLEEMRTTQEELQRQAGENKKYRSELEKENALLDSLMNNSPDYIYFKDLECKFIRISQSMLKLFSYDTLEEMVGKSDFDFQPKDVAQKYYNDEQTIMKSGEALINDIQHEVMSNGLEQWVATTKMPLMNRSGKCIGLFGVTKDITDLKKLEIEATQKAAMLEEQEEELRQNLEEMRTTQEELQRQAGENKKYRGELEKENALLDSLMNNSPDYIYFKDLECKFIRISQSMLKLFPYDTLEEMVGKSDFDFQPKEVAQKYYDDEQTIMKSGKALINDIQHEVMSNGVEQWVTTTKMPLLSRGGKCIGLFGVTKDITELKKLEIDATEKAAILEEQEEELRQNLEEMRTTQEEMDRVNKDLQNEKALMDSLMLSIPDRIYFKDKDSVFMQVSNSMLKLFGLKSKDELVGKSTFDMLNKEYADKLFADEKRIMETGEGLIDDIVEEKKDDGSSVWVSTTKLPVYNEKGDAIGTFGITKDITKIKRMELDARAQTAQLQEHEEELRQSLEEMHTIQDDMGEQIKVNEKLRIDLSKENALLNAMLSTLPEYIYFKDKDSKFIRISDSMLKLFPVKTVDEMVGKSDFDFQPKEAAQKYYDDEQEIMKTGKGIVDDVQHEVMSNGYEQWVATTKLPLYNREGECIGTFGITKDITKLKKLEIASTMQAQELKKQEKTFKESLVQMNTLQHELDAYVAKLTDATSAKEKKAIQSKIKSLQKEIEKLKNGD